MQSETTRGVKSKTRWSLFIIAGLLLVVSIVLPDVIKNRILSYVIEIV
jgi:hypothetical protein